MLLPVFLVLQLQAPQRLITDPGIIATNTRVTPAGVQSVFTGRVAGVRFGATADELWVVVPGSAWHLAWRDNRVLGHAAFNGRPGVHGITIDPATQRAVIASVGKLPEDVAKSRTPGGPPLARAKSVAQIVSYRVNTQDGTARDSGLAIATSSGPLGDFMAGAPSYARTANAGRERLAVLPLPADDKLAILNADNGKLLRTVALGVLPIASVIANDGGIAWVSVFGGPKPKVGERKATQCCDPAAEPVRVDARGLAARGTVARIDLQSGVVTHNVQVGLHPTGLVWDQLHGRLYVANGNSDSVSVVDTRRNLLLGAIAIAPFRERKIGLAPTAVALSPDATTLFVTLGGINAVAMYALSDSTSTSLATLKGLIPTGWYPSSLDVSADGKTLAVGTLFGVGAGTGTTAGKTARYVFAERGSVNVIAMPTDAELSAYTTSVAQNNRLHLASGEQAPSLAPRQNIAARAVPERPGEASLIEHVVYIIKENRTYDQVLGDIGKGASDSSLTMYGRDVTPNAHALSEQFVLLDHFFASGGNSADGHNWLTQANETAYPMWPLYFGRSYPSEGNDPLTYSAGGFLWEAATANGKRVVSFGEYAPAPSDSVPSVRARLMAQYRDSPPHNSAFFRAQLKKMYNTHSEVPSLDKILVREYPGWTQEVPDVIKADIVIEHIKEWESAKKMPNLTLIVLPNDHTQGTSAGWCAPKACVADNDLGLGKIVEALSHSTFWKRMAIVVVEDDAQNGVDHIDGHRTVALVASPYAKRGAIDSTFYSQPSMVKTIELMLGLPALSMFDLVATDMRASFIGPSEKPDLRPYTALVPTQSLYETNLKVGAITGPHALIRRTAAQASARMNFHHPDAAPSGKLNRILWGDAKGWAVKYPVVKRSLFFPLAVDVADDEREEKPEKHGKKMSAAIQTADSLIQSALGTQFPGAVFVVARNGVVLHERAFGFAQLNDGQLRRLPKPPLMRTTTMFDLASVTKVMATTMSVMMLVTRGQIDIDAPVSRYLTDFRGLHLDSITVRHLLQHSAGLVQWQPLYYHASSKAQTYALIRDMPLAWGVGEGRHYSDLGFMLLGYIVEQVSRQPLDAFVRDAFYTPLGLHSTMFVPKAHGVSAFAATESGNGYEKHMVYDSTFGYRYRGDPTAWNGWRTSVLNGETNDGNSWYANGGVAGHAGLFSTGAELRVLLDLLRTDGTAHGRQYIAPAVVHQFLTRDQYDNYLGWMRPADLPTGSFMHTGFTGTWVLGVPHLGLSVVLLTNKQNVGANANGNFPNLTPLQNAIARALVQGAETESARAKR